MKRGRFNVVLVIVGILANLYLCPVLSEGEFCIVSSRAVRIYYKVKKGSPKEIVLWVKKEGDKNGWRQVGVYKTGEDIIFQADEEGYYLFKILPAGVIPEGNGGFRCLIDFSPPILDIIGVTYLDGKLYITWTAYDKNFTIKPIEVYLLKKNGITEFVDKFPNTGKTNFKISDTDFPLRVKLVAIDLAGNIATDVSQLMSFPGTAKRGNLSTTKPTEKSNSTEMAMCKSRPLQKKIKFLSPSIPKEAKVEFELAKKYIANREYAPAKERLEHAIKIAPYYIDALFALGELNFKSRRFTEAKKYLEQVIKLNPNHTDSLFILARIAVKEAQFKRAEKLLEKLVKFDNSHIQGWIYLGDVYWIVGKEEDAKLVWKKALTLSKEKGLDAVKNSVEARLKLLAERENK